MSFEIRDRSFREGSRVGSTELSEGRSLFQDRVINLTRTATHIRASSDSLRLSETGKDVGDWHECGDSLGVGSSSTMQEA